jgi:hypothetical protein
MEEVGSRKNLIADFGMRIVRIEQFDFGFIKMDSIP